MSTPNEVLACMAGGAMYVQPGHLKPYIKTIQAAKSVSEAIAKCLQYIEPQCIEAWCRSMFSEVDACKLMWAEHTRASRTI
jgi:hypothetical protein